MPSALLPLLSRAPLKNLFNKVFIHPILTYAFPGWFPLLSSTHITFMKRMHRSSCSAITGCLPSTLIPKSISPHCMSPSPINLSLTSNVSLDHLNLFL